MKSEIPTYTIQNFKSYKNDDILVSKFGYYFTQNQHLNAPHRHSFYHLVYFTKGNGRQQIDFKKFDVKAGLIYFMTPGQVHSWDFDTAPDGYIINFSPNYFNSFLLNPDYLENFTFFSGKTDHQVIELPIDTQQIVTSIFEDILKDGQNKAQLNDDLVKTLLIRLFIEVARNTEEKQLTSNTSYNHTILKNFKNLIEQNYTKLRLPKQYAALLYITPNHLNALCNDFLGVSAGTLIRDRVILEAKRLLINVDLLISEIAVKLNFDDQSYFIKFFKKYEGLTPEKFRKINTIQHGNKR